jgi:hypothetical protein
MTRILKRVALAIAGLIVALALVGALLYEFGTMERPSPRMTAAFQRMVAVGQARPVPAVWPAVPIPGCRCHSKDPVQTMLHTTYRIRDCGRCHGARRSP